MLLNLHMWNSFPQTSFAVTHVSSRLLIVSICTVDMGDCTDITGTSPLGVGTHPPLKKAKSMAIISKTQPADESIRSNLPTENAISAVIGFLKKARSDTIHLTCSDSDSIHTFIFNFWCISILCCQIARPGAQCCSQGNAGTKEGSRV